MDNAFFAIIYPLVFLYRVVADADAVVAMIAAVDAVAMIAAVDYIPVVE